MPHPTPETLAQTQVRTPAEFTHDAFRELVAEARAACGITVGETACLWEFQHWVVEGVIVEATTNSDGGNLPSARGWIEARAHVHH